MDPAVFSPRRFTDFGGWSDGDHRPALDAFCRSAARFLAGTVGTGSLGIAADAFRPAAEAVLALGAADEARSRAFFETHFVPVLVAPDADAAAGFVTGYYEPVVDASLRPTALFTVPLHRPPADLMPVDEANRPPDLDPYLAFARRRADGGLEPYPDRAAIRRGLLDGRGLEIAWLRDPVDAFFIHVQGSARLRLEDGRTLRVGYAGKTGHRFTAIGRILVAEGELALENADMAGIRRWLADHPDRVQPLLDRNRSYIFFQETMVADEDLGPVGAAKVPLRALASLAVDRLLHTFGTPFFLDAPTLSIAGTPFRRLLVAQDTGSAIVGRARGDIFVGSGEAAGRVAGGIRHPAAFFALVPERAAAALRP